MLADHPVQRLVGGFSFTNKILLLSSPAHHGWLGLITYGYVGVKTSAHPFPMRLEPTLRLAIHECSLHRNKLGSNGSTAKPVGQLAIPLPRHTHNAEEKYQQMHTPAHEGPRLGWGLGGISLAPACACQMSLSNSDNRPEMSLASLSPAHLSTTRRHLPCQHPNHPTSCPARPFTQVFLTTRNRPAEQAKLLLCRDCASLVR